MRNLSPGGVMVDCGVLREPGSLVRLEMPGLGTVAGKVAWCTAGRMGIAFDTPIDPALVRDEVATGRGFQADLPVLARFLRERLEQRGHAAHATIAQRRHGAQGARLGRHRTDRP